MCGIVFSASRQGGQKFVRAAHLLQKHRGPDGGGRHLEVVRGVHLSFAHERLSIVDLSPRGAQPMESRSKRSLIIFNGEIYNHRELAVKFNLGPLRSASDTEVALELIEKIGIERASRQFNGMWTIIFLDRREQRVSLSRDRFGKKPLNFLSNASGIFFASEVRALAVAPGFNFKINPKSAARFLVQSLQNTDEETWIDDIKAFPPGHTAELDLNADVPALRCIKPFWSPPLDKPRLHRSEKEWVEELRATVQDAVQIRLAADVPVGVALSGGLDSSIIARVASENQQQSGASFGLFSAVNPGAKDDESAFVDIMELALGHEVSRFDLELNGSKTLFDLLAFCNLHNDGPVSSFSNLLFYELMKKAKSNGITVILTGQGADEAFCGYRKYPFFYILQLLKAGQFIRGVKTLGGFLSNSTILKDIKYAELKRYIGAANTNILGMASQEAYAPLSLGAASNLAQRQWQDIAHFSVPYLCHYEDRMSMAASCEVRTPFLDYRVVELGLSMPEELKLDKGWTKLALRRAFEKDLPAEIVWRKDKKGFVNPQDKWLQTTLKDNVLATMQNSNHPVYTEGLVDRTAYLKLFSDYCNGDKRIWFREVFAPFSLAVWANQMTQFTETTQEQTDAIISNG